MSDLQLFALISCGLEVSNSYTLGCDQILKRERSKISNGFEQDRVVNSRGARDALRTTHQNQHHFFQGTFSSSTQHQRDIQSKISHQNNINEISSLKLVINATSSRNPV